MAQWRMPLPYWRNDTFVAYSPAIKPIDSFYSFTGSGGETMINVHGVNYVAFIDTQFNKYKADAQTYVIDLAKSINDTTVLSYVSQFYPHKFKLSGNYIQGQASFHLPQSPFGTNAESDNWMGRDK